MPKDEMGKDVSVPELAEDTGKKAQNIAKKEGAGRPATPEYNADRVRRAAQGSALNEAGLSFEDVKGDDGGYLYKLNPDKSVTIVYDPTGRASGVTLTPGTRQRTAYEAILKNVYEMEPPSAPAKAPRVPKVSPQSVAAPAAPQAFSEAAGADMSAMDEIELRATESAPPSPAAAPEVAPAQTGAPALSKDYELEQRAIGSLRALAKMNGGPLTKLPQGFAGYSPGVTTLDDTQLKKLVDGGVLTPEVAESMRTTVSRAATGRLF